MNLQSRINISTSTQANHLAKWWQKLPSGKIQCDLCPRECKLGEGQRGLCYVRQRQNDKIILTTYNYSSGFAIDPIEKKPLFHFYPATSILSFGTAGCNLTCQFCQNWDISKSRDNHRLTSYAPPEAIVKTTIEHNVKAIAYTYNDPIIFAEYAIDTAKLARTQRIKNVAVTAGYINPTPAREFFGEMDAVNMDLKAFSASFYHKLCSAKFTNILETLQFIYHQTKCHLEITTLLIPNHNDSIQEINSLTNWLVKNLGVEVPLHFSAFHPSWKMLDTPRTSLSTLISARKIAMDNGLNFVYIGNIHDDEGSSTFCPQCKDKLIIRRGYQILENKISSTGVCPKCKAKIYGKY